MRRFFGVVAGCCLVVSACSGSSTEPESDASGTPDASGALAEQLGVEPLTEAISDDADEQAAAEASFVAAGFFDMCSDDPKACDTSKFAEVYGEAVASDLVERFEERKQLDVTIEQSELPHETRILWARKSTSDDDLVGVLVCRRNLNKIYNADGSVVSDSTATSYGLELVRRGDDGKWRQEETVSAADSFQAGEDEADTCSRFDGTEVSDDFLASFLG